MLPGTVALPFTGTGLFAEPVGVCPDVSGIGSGIFSQDDLKGNRLSNQAMEYLIEDFLSQPITEVGEGAIGRGLHVIKPTKEAEPGIMQRAVANLR